MKKIFNSYNSLLLTHPFPTKMITSGFLFGLGDAICQFSIEKCSFKDYSISRTLKNSFVGAVFAAPYLHVWYNFLSKMSPKLYPVGTKNQEFKTVFTNVFLDQTFFAFSFLSGYFLMINFLEYGNFEKGFQTIREKGKESIIMNWKIWPLAQTINFYFVPL